jgi:competence ComEA-like helix-hairpin-helix protein
MLTNSEKRVLIFIVFVLLLGSLGGFLRPWSSENEGTAAKTIEREKNFTSFPININNATVKELGFLPGIGEVLAKRIVEYRIKNNGFNTKEEIMNIKGIGKVKFGKIKDKICVE